MKAKKIQPDNCFAQYNPERRTVQILTLLKLLSDEEHPITQKELLDAIPAEERTTNNAETLSRSIDEILFQINPKIYSESEELNYRIKYVGYRENRVLEKLELKDRIKAAYEETSKDKAEIKSEILGKKQKKLPTITGLSYIHDLTYDELDDVIQAVCFSETVCAQDKTSLVGKLCNIASRHYKTPYYNRDTGKLLFNPKGIYSRTGSGVYNKTAALSDMLGENLRRIQSAVSERVQIRFSFNMYDEYGRLKRIDRSYPPLSPYYIVVYHDMFYLIGGHDGKVNISHYRIDLMSDIEKAVSVNGENIPAARMSDYPEFKHGNDWNPQKYMSEHIYMAYDEPRKIRLKIKSDKYTVLHDMFGNNYRKCNIQCDDGYNVAEVVSSPEMLVHWAMQYAGTVEILDEQIRERIQDEIRKIEKTYGNI